MTLNRNYTLKHLPIFLYANSLRFMLRTIAILVVIAVRTVPCHFVVAIVLSVVVLIVVEGFLVDIRSSFGLDVVMFDIVLGRCYGYWILGRDFCRGLWF